MLSWRKVVLGQGEALFHPPTDQHAVQLAVALELHNQRVSAGQSAVTLVSADQELNAAATAEILVVEDPNQHP